MACRSFSSISISIGIGWLPLKPTPFEPTPSAAANSFDIEFVTIGNPGNAADDVSANPDFAGSVPYTYRIGKFEISEQMIDKANALGGLGITKDTRGGDKPATVDELE